MGPASLSRPAQASAHWAPLPGLAIGLVLATGAGLVSLRAGVAGIAVAQAQVVGLAYLVAGAIAWRRRPDNRTGPLLLAIGYSWYLPDFQAAPVPVVAALAFATRRLVNALSAAIFAFNVLSSILAVTTALTHALGWVLSLARATVPVGFLLGLLRMRIDKAAVATLVVGLHDERRRGSLERAMADALHDPGAKLGY